MSFPKTVCLDFDGVIHSYTSGWQGADIVADGPVPGAIFAMYGYHLGNLEVSVFSSRSNQFGGIAAMKSAIRGWAFDALRGESTPKYLTEQVEGFLNAIKYPTEKPAAWITIDDRAVQFKGDFPAVQEINDFKPWYK
jgi:hypothetical protein